MRGVRRQLQSAGNVQDWGLSIKLDSRITSCLTADCASRMLSEISWKSFLKPNFEVQLRVLVNSLLDNMGSVKVDPL